MILITLISTALGLARVAGLTHIAFQAAAHVWVGGLIACRMRGKDKIGSGCMYQALGLSVLETVCAVFGTFKLTP